MIARLLILLLLTSMPLLGESEDDVTSVVTSLATALSENNPPLFLKSLDRDMSNYRDIERQITALASGALIDCTIEVIGITGSGTAQQADLDWYMVLRSQQDENLIERRRTKVTVKVEKRGKKWIITSFSPSSIFAPMAPR